MHSKGTENAAYAPGRYRIFTMPVQGCSRTDKQQRRDKMQFGGIGKPVMVCNKCHKTIRINPRYKTVGGIEYNYFTCKKCGEAYVISATDEALRHDI